VSALFTFGFGLSYTQFQIGPPKLAQACIKANQTTTVTVEVTNSGSRAGEEVIQLYIRDLVSSVTRPVKELKGFARISMEPGETKKVSLPITPESLACFGLDYSYRVEPGEFKIMVGNSSLDEDLQETVLTVT
jgi:beta-glucosidase